jgi:hypothetical protein
LTLAKSCPNCCFLRGVITCLRCFRLLFLATDFMTWGYVQMRIFEVTAPNGTKYRVTGPDGATEQDAPAQVQKHIQVSTPDRSSFTFPAGTPQQTITSAIDRHFGNPPSGQQIVEFEGQRHAFPADFSQRFQRLQAEPSGCWTG